MRAWGTTKRHSGGVVNAIVTLALLLPAVAWTPSGAAGARETVGTPSEHATIHRDSYGVPHISSATMAGMWFGAGWAQATDRLVQLELVRRSVRGTLAELFGPGQLDSDIGARTFFYSDAELTAQLASLPDRFRETLVAFADGINAYESSAYAGATSLTKVPYEFFVLGRLLGLAGPYRPAPWQPIDTVAIGNFLARDFGAGGGNELNNLAFYQYLQAEFASKGDAAAGSDAWAVFNDARWINDPTAPTTVPGRGPAAGPAAAAAAVYPAARPATMSGPRATIGPPPVVSLAPALTKAAAAAWQRHRDLIRATGQTLKVPWRDGSNAFVVAPWRTQSGHAVLWGAPQEGFGTPSIDGEEYLDGPGYSAGGMYITGSPTVLIGHNRDIAWTTTSEQLVDQQIYVEQVDFSTSPPSYRFNGSWLPMTVIHESVPVAGQVAHDLAILRTIHGPVFSADPASGVAFSMRFASWMKETGTLLGFGEMGGDHNLNEYRASVAKVTTLHNFFYADRRGNIAYFGAGLLPILPACATCDPRLPHLGDGSQEWQGFEPFAQMPHSVNPPQGYLVNWNTKPDQAHFYQQNGGDEYWGTIYRSDRIAQLLSRADKLSQSDILGVERDIGTMDGDQTYRPAAAFLLDPVLEAYDRQVAAHDPLTDPHAHPLTAAAVGALRAWNRTTSLGSPGMSIWVELMASLQANLWGGGRSSQLPFTGTVNLRDGAIGLGDFLGMATYNLTWHVYGATGGLVPCNRLCFAGDYTAGHGDQLLVESLNDATLLLAGNGPVLANGGATGFGTPDVSRWGWKPYADINWDSLDPLAVGVTTRLGTSPSQERSTFMMAVDAGPTLRAVDVLPPGQSGFIDARGRPNPHFGDQVALFNAFAYKPMQLDP